MMPVPQCAKVRHDFEQNARLARLNLGSGNSRAAHLTMASLLRRRRQKISGRAETFFEGETHNAF
jgi:hypothetical protein